MGARDTTGGAGGGEDGAADDSDYESGPKEWVAGYEALTDRSVGRGGEEVEGQVADLEVRAPERSRDKVTERHAAVDGPEVAIRDPYGL